MNIFELLCLAHLFGDYLVQTESEALNKANGRFFNRALIMHCLKYTACFVAILLVMHMSLFWLLPIFWSHMLFDRRWPIIWWRKHITGNSDESIKQTFWLTVIIDQIFHLTVLAVIALLSL